MPDAVPQRSYHDFNISGNATVHIGDQFRADKENEEEEQRKALLRISVYDRMNSRRHQLEASIGSKFLEWIWSPYHGFLMAEAISGLQVFSILEPSLLAFTQLQHQYRRFVGRRWFVFRPRRNLNNEQLAVLASLSILLYRFYVGAGQVRPGLMDSTLGREVCCEIVFQFLQIQRGVRVNCIREDVGLFFPWAMGRSREQLSNQTSHNSPASATRDDSRMRPRQDNFKIFKAERARGNNSYELGVLRQKDLKLSSERKPKHDKRQTIRLLKLVLRLEDINSFCYSGGTVLHALIQHGDDLHQMCNLIHILKNHGIDFNVSGPHGTVLELAWKRLKGELEGQTFQSSTVSIRCVIDTLKECGALGISANVTKGQSLQFEHSLRCMADTLLEETPMHVSLCS